MEKSQPFTVRSLESEDVDRFRAMLDLLGRAFEDEDTYSRNQPGDAYIKDLLGSNTFFALVAEDAGDVVGAIAGYELKKFEQERSEFYIYDLAVAETHRRQGVATGLIKAFGKIAKERGGWVMFVQADPVDAPAVALYEKLGTREDVYHFDIEPE